MTASLQTFIYGQNVERMDSESGRSHPSRIQIRTWLLQHIASALDSDVDTIDTSLGLQYLGLSSREAIMLSGELETWLERRLSPTIIWEHETIDALADYLAQVPASEAVKAAPVQTKTGSQLSFAQERVWYLEQLTPNTAAYTIPDLTLRLSGELDIKALERALTEICRRHDTLRMAIRVEEDRPTAVIRPVAPVQAHVFDLKHLQASIRELEAMRLLKRELARPFDLEQGPLWRVLLIQLRVDTNILAIPMHHIIADGWSLGVFLKELETYYVPRLDSLPALPDLPLQYADFAIWQRQEVDVQVAEQNLDYWTTQLANSSQHLNLPTDRLRPALQSNAGARYRFRIDTDTHEAMQALCRRQGVTSFTAYLAALFVFLYRYSEQQDLSVGIPVAGRSARETRSMIGMFVNTLVIRGDLSGDPSFMYWLERLGTTTLAALEHQDQPFEGLVAAMSSKRDLSHSPLFQVMFVYHNWPLSPPQLGELIIEVVDVDNGTSKFDLTLSLLEMAGGIECTFEYSTDIFNEETIQHMARHFVTLLNAILKTPHASISRLPLLTADDRYQLVTVWNDTQAAFPKQLCIHELFERQVQAKDNHIALSDAHERISYAKLNKRANQLAYYLLAQGVMPGDRIAICLDRSVAIIVAILGILKAGAVFVILDPNWPEQRLAYISAEIAASLLLTQRRLFKRIDSISARVVSLDEVWSDIGKYHATNPNRVVCPSDLAYVLYTSGSTGQPKGVMVEHRQLVNSTCARNRFYDEPVTRFLLLSSSAFDSSLVGIFWTLCEGAELVLPEENALQDMQLLVQSIAQRKITHLLALPSLYGLILDIAQPEQLTSLQTVVVAGEVCPVDLVKRHFSICPAVRLYNEYGPTEGTVWCSGYEITQTVAQHLQAGDNVSIGRPISNVQLYVLDKYGEPLPIGIPGELYIGGEGVARGYLNRPDLTEQSFVENTFISTQDERLYRTGDKVRYRADANLEFIGRLDNQIKLRGYRIEPGEIEQRLRQHPTVHEAAVLAIALGSKRKQLVAYVTAPEQQLCRTQELRDFLSQALPAYMVPSHFLVLETLPRTDSGKIDRRALPLPQVRAAVSEDTQTQPINDVEMTLMSIWGSVLRLDNIGRNDNFFELGGDSITSIQVITRARQAGFELKPQDFIVAPTIAELATVAVVARDRSRIAQDKSFSPSPYQRWRLANRLQRELGQQTLWLEFKQEVSPDLLVESIRASLNFNDALRMQLSDNNGDSTFIDTIPLPTQFFTKLELSHLTGRDLEKTLQKQASALALDLTRSASPLFKALYVDLGKERPARLLLILHELIVDHDSWPVILADWESIYGMISRGQKAKLPIHRDSYGAWLHAIATIARAGKLVETHAFWMEQVSAPLAPLPHDVNVGVTTEDRLDSLVASLDRENTQRLLAAVSQVDAAKLDEILLTALALTLVKWTGSRTQRIMLLRDGRATGINGLDLSNTVGCFYLRCPLLFLLKDDDDPLSALKVIKERTRSMPYQGLTYGLLQQRQELEENVGPAIGFHLTRDWSQNEFQLFHMLDKRLAYDPLDQEQDIQVRAYLAEDSLKITWHYRATRYQRTTVESLAARQTEAVTSLVDSCLAGDAGTFTPADFPAARIEQRELDKLINRLKRKDLGTQ